MVFPFPFASIVGTGALILGRGPPIVDGSLALPLGKPGRELTIKQCYAAVRLTPLLIIGILQREMGEINRIKDWTRLFGMVNLAPGFNCQPSVFNGASALILELFGADIGAHTCGAVSTPELPFDIAVAIELYASSTRTLPAII